MDDKFTLRPEPHKAKSILGAIQCKEACWYENGRSIDVYIESKNGPVYSCRIERRHLLSWIKRTALKKETIP